ncbi:MutH/Sau3AI family endonuclease [uncultured Methanolobus sp.]|uniref:MutH/Sau3AI family endonuclease n=1 Tax=uncultured Methanolobus sp. TaxID=218300 RepID=UPI0029C7DB47|nr:MutH/Sau3AI family endonuclease [uncultured Methanolobus sp.]
MSATKFDLPYDRLNPKDIERYAKDLVGKKFSDLYIPEWDDKKVFGSIGNKGHLGQYLERFYFMYEPNSSKYPDFLEAGVELKVPPLKQLKNKELRAKERIVLSIIDYNTIVEEKWEESSFLHKNNLLLLVFYLHEGGKDRLDFVIRMVTLWDYDEKDLEIIKQDWHKIVNKIREGKAHELSERDTLYLGACPKGANCGSTRKEW